MMSQNRAHPRISIIVPTFNRHDGLNRCLSSLFALSDTNIANAELIVADNSPDANASDVFETLTANAPLPCKYVSETAPGVSNVRNSALEIAEGSLVAWLDDDQTAEPGWLDELVKAHDVYGATVSFGPTLPVLPESTRKYRSYFTRFFERPQLPQDGLIDAYFGCGHSLIDLVAIRQMLPENAPLFDVEANDLGGEDDRLFQMVLDKGGTIAWNRQAGAHEHPPAHRVKLSYTLQRSFVYGQGPSCSAIRRSPPDVPKLLYWMGVGVGQSTIYGLSALTLRILGDETWANWADKAIRGVGKVLWFPPFQLRFYGAAYNQRKPNADQTSDLEEDMEAETLREIEPATSGDKASQPAN